MPAPPNIADMTEHLTLNIVIHAAVRRDVARFQQALTAFPIGSRERAAQLEMAWQNLDHQLYHPPPWRGNDLLAGAPGARS